tara:strand:- start:581 stop:4084 length:3504 start_codon:yes stop_codon:yes gene_type:complete
MANAIPDFTVEDLFSSPSNTDDSVTPVAPISESSPGSAVNAELLQMLKRGEDPRSIFPQEQGLLGKSDVFSYETEKSFSPRVREFVRQYYGPAEIQYNPEGGVVSNFFTRMFGSAPTEEEKQQIARAQVLRERGSISADAKYKRMLGELFRGTPSAADIRGDLPEGYDDPESKNYIPPYLREFSKVGRLIELPKFEAKVLLRDYGVVQGTDEDQKTIEKARTASTWINQLESITPGLAKHTLGPILAESFNKRYGEGTATVEGLNLRQITFEGSPKLVYTHPETNQTTMFDPVKLELTDIMEIAPELMVIGGDIAGMGFGTLAGSAVGGPKTAIAGSIVGGATGAYFGRMLSLRKALREYGFKVDERLGGFVKEGFNDESGNPLVIQEQDLHLKAMPDALFSIAGNIGARAIFKLGRLALYGTTGADAMKGGLTVEQFERAVDSFRKTNLGETAAVSGQKAPTSVVLQKAGEDLIERSRIGGLGPEDAKNMFEEGQAYLRQAEVLRTAEQGTGAESARVGLREEIVRKGEGEAAVDAPLVAGARSEEVATAVQKGMPIKAQTEVNKQVDELIEANRNSIDELEKITAPGTDTAAADLGKSFVAKGNAIMGTPDGLTGVYGVFNQIQRALSRQGQAGIPTRPFEVGSLLKEVDKLQKRSAAIGGAFPKGFLESWNATVRRVQTKAGEKSGQINLNYGQMKDLILSIRSELGGNLSQPQRKSLSDLLGKMEKVQLDGLKIVDEANAARGVNTSYAVQQLVADNQLKQLASIWQRGMTQGLEEGTYGKIANKLFAPNADPNMVGNIMATLRPGKNQLELMRNTLLYRYKQAMQGAARGEVSEGADLAGRRIRIGLDADDLTVVRADQATHGTFMRENETWINTLFKKGEFDKLTEEVSNVTKQQADLKGMEKFQESLRVSLGGNVALTDDLGRAIINEPNKLVDEIYKLGVAERVPAFMDMYKALKFLPKEERYLAREQIRGLLFRKLLTPEDTMAGARDEPFDALNASTFASRELKDNSRIYDMAFGKKHREALETIFRDIGTLSRAEQGAAGLFETLSKPRTQIPLAALKVYVGVLNRRARALTQGQKVLGEKLDSKFREALLDPDKALALVKGRNISQKSKLLTGLLGQILGIETGEAIDAVQTFGIDFQPEFTGIPESSLVREGLR